MTRNALLVRTAGVLSTATALIVVVHWGFGRDVAPRSELFRLEHGMEAGVTLVFQEGDCPDLLAALRIWNQVADARVHVRGLVVGAGSDDAADAAARLAGLRFPAAPARGSDVAALLRRLGHTTTPILVATDAAGRVRVVAPAEELPPARVIAVLGLPHVDPEALTTPPGPGEFP